MSNHRAASVLKPSRVVTLGAHGFVASRLIRLLSMEGIPHRALGRSEVDLVEPSSAATLQRIIHPDDAVVVLSALTPEKGRDRSTFLKNVAMIDHLCAAVSEAPCLQVVYISSDSVYDSRCTEISENSCCESEDMYALSHIVREKLLTGTCREANIALAILRPCAIYGPGDTHNSYGPNRFLRTALKEGKITLFGHGEEERDHIYIDDLVRVIKMCLLHGVVGVLNAATGRSLSFREVAAKVIEAIGRDVVIDSAPRRMPIVDRRFDTTALRRAFPAFQPTPFQTGIGETLAEIAKEGPARTLHRPFGSAQ